MTRNPFATSTTTPAPFTPTTQQQACIDALYDGKHILTQAVAGSGKTSTLGLLGAHLPQLGKRGLYLAFNKAIVQDVRGVFDTRVVDIRTMHSLAYAVMRNSDEGRALLEKLQNRGGSKYALVKRFDVPKYQYRPITDAKIVPKGGPAPEPKKVQYQNSGGYQTKRYTRYTDTVPVNFYNDDVVGLAAFNIAGYDPDIHDLYVMYDKKRTMRPGRFYDYVIEALHNWCCSDSDVILTEHITPPPHMAFDTVDAYRRRVLAIARRMWDEDITQPDGEVWFSHDYYLKMVSLQDVDLTQVPSLGLRKGDVIFFDEAQDARPAMTRIIRAQAARGCQIVIVGDSAQAIYASFTGAEDALQTFTEDLAEADPSREVAHIPLTISWRFGNTIADMANSVLRAVDNSLVVQGNPDVDSRVMVHPFFDDISTSPRKLDNYGVDMGDLKYIYGADFEFMFDYNDIPELDAILTRSNADALRAAMLCNEFDINYTLMMDIQSIRRFIDDYVTLMLGGTVKYGQLAQFEDFDEMLAYPKQDGIKDQSLATLITLVHKHHPHGVREVLELSTKEGTPGAVTISTVHKAKGRQWNRVAIFGVDVSFIPDAAYDHDRTHCAFGTNAEKDADDADKTLTLYYREALHVLYVACTRARKVLYVPAKIIYALDDLTEFLESKRTPQMEHWRSLDAYKKASTVTDADLQAPAPQNNTDNTDADAGTTIMVDDLEAYAENVASGFSFYED